MANKKKIRRVKLATLVMVGEGAHDKAFLNHLKALYDDRDSGQKVTIHSADGGSPSDIIDTAMGKNRYAGFDRCFVLLDSDVPIAQKDRAKAKKKKLVLVESTPYCLEGMLLEILGQAVPVTNAACKNSLHPQLADKPANPKAYKILFPKAVLNVTTKEQIVLLRQVIANTKQVKK